MKTRSLLTYALLPAAGLLLLAASCNLIDRSTQSWSLPQPVSIAGGDEWAVLFPSGYSWKSSSDHGGRAGLLLRDGDVFGGRVMTIYRTQDGRALELAEDAWSTRLAGTVIAVSLESGDEGREWLAKASDHELAAVRCLTLPDKFEASLLPVLKRLAAANPGVALFVSSDVELRQVLPLFRPQVLGINGGASDADLQNILADQQQITTVIVSAEAPGSLDPLRQLHGLRHLTITDWKVEAAGPLPAGLDALRSVSVFGSSMKDLSPLRTAPVGLQELSLHAEELTDVRALAQWPNLRAVILSDNEKLVGLPDLADLKQLQWANLPPETTQEQLSAFLAAHRNLKILELVGCKNITDLAPLREMRDLEGLILAGPYEHFEVLRDLKSLRFIGLPPDAFEKSPDQVAAIRKALPDALVVPVSGLCLGSGWILLLIPAIAGVRFLRRRHATADACHG